MIKIIETKYDEKIYTEVKMQDLILFSIYLVSINGETCTFERLVRECFTKFPKVFAFKRYPDWPDSLKLDRPLRTLREEGLIVGSVRGYFELTEFGGKIAKETESVLGNKGIAISKKMKLRGRSIDDKLIEYVRESVPFKKFLANPEDFDISESEFRSLLRCTLETPERVLKQNLAYYKNIAESYKEEQILQLLLACEKKFIRKKVKNA